MISVSMPYCEVSAVRGRPWLGRLLACLFSMLLATHAEAHKGSDAYVQLRLDGDASTLRVDLALRDLDVVLDIDTDANGQLTWGEVRSAYPAIERYLSTRVQVDGCRWQSAVRALERRADGVYAALTWSGHCDPRDAWPTIHYSALREVDPTHRAIARIERADGAAVLQVLDPASISVAEAKESTQPPTGAGPLPSASVPGLAGSDSPTASDARPPSAPHPADTPAASGFIREGMRHILGGYDHVLFLLCLLLPAVMRRASTGWQPVERLGQALWPVATIVTAFTLAHSVTLTLAGLKLVSLSPSFIEPAIALTIVLAAVDNLTPIFHGRRAIVTFLFGLIHGFGFASVLGELNLPTAQFAWALFQFNLGIELGQLLIVLVAVAALFGFRHQRWYRPVVIHGGSAVAIVIGALWFIERTAHLAILPF